MLLQPTTAAAAALHERPERRSVGGPLPGDATPQSLLEFTHRVSAATAPEAGISRNWFVFVRSWALIVLIGAGELVQIGQGCRN